MDKNSVKGIILIVFIISLIAAVVVSSVSVYLQPIQEENRMLDRWRNILIAFDIHLKKKEKIQKNFNALEAYVFDFETNQIIEGVDIASFDPAVLAKDPKTSKRIPKKDDIAVLIRHENQGIIYVLRDESGALNKVALPVRGYGLWNTMYGYIALEADLNTIAGITFYQHGETPGLGGEISNPKWQAKWVGKRLYDEQNALAFKVIKGAVNPSQKNAIYQVDGISGATLTSKGVSNMVAYWFGEENGYRSILKWISKQVDSGISDPVIN